MSESPSTTNTGEIDEHKLNESLAKMLKVQEKEGVVDLSPMVNMARDEALAKQLSMEEEQAHAISLDNPAIVHKRIKWFNAPLVCLILSIAVAIWYFLIRPRSDQDHANAPFLVDSDPFAGLSPNEVAKWGSEGGNGLKLTVVNALDEDWQEIFQQVVGDWTNGASDVLELSVEQTDPDPTCEPGIGQSKVCNGDYGATDWKGINIAVTYMGFIQSCSARMNEYYLSSDSAAQRRYTLCHEMGHALGVPHSDENYFNQDLGNCMDYTQNPEANQQPDASNFEFLKEMYGTLPSGGANRNGNQRRLRIGDGLPLSLPKPVLTAVGKVVANVHASGPQQRERSLQGELLRTMEVGDGWALQVHTVAV